MFTKTHTFTHPRTGLSAAAKHYRRNGPQTGLTLVFSHGISLTKELWEPTIQRLFELDTTHTIRDAWSLDWQSHGESGGLNRAALVSRPAVTAAEYADLLAYFTTSSFVAGCQVVAVGHSAGGSSWVLASTYMRSSPLMGMILVEPACIVPPVVPNDMRIAVGQHNVRASSQRPFAWRSYREAAAFHSAHAPWNRWDERVLRLYLQHGLSEMPTGAVETKCMKNQEIGVYEVRPGSEHIVAGNELARLSARLPVHMVFGERPEMITRKGRMQLCDASAGRKMASVQLIPAAGHLAVQENPNGVAASLFNILLSFGIQVSATSARL
ncbi:unnamed protein product [Peniophora sp. CBMAI 1063]|nr:unnamed protein product [Peniophora sp. CBMAI 1063]